MAYVGGALALVGVAVARRKPRTKTPNDAPPARRGCHAAPVSIVADVARRPRRRAAPLLPGARDVPLDQARRAADFGTDAEFAEETKVLAANQGLYNGFLAAGLVWGLVDDQTDVQVFFLACVIVAGVYGAATVSRRILFVQARTGRCSRWSPSCVA